MPLFTDPDRRQESRWSEDHDHESQAPGSPLIQAGSQGHGQRETLVVAETAAGPIQPTALNPLKMWTNEREELIHRIKESSPWRLQRGSPEVSHDHGMPHTLSELKPVEEQASEWQHPKGSEELGSPADIQRPRSALHSGDFSEGATADPPQSPRALFAERRNASPFPLLSTSPTTPWFGTPAFPTPLRRPNTGDYREGRVAVETRSRAPSLGSFSSSYVLKTPTSPLVHQANNTDLDFSPRIDPVEVAEPSDRANRRRTLPPGSFRHLESSPPASRGVHLRSPCPPGRREDLFSLQPSSPRRSLTSAYSLQLASSGQSPISRARRPSLATDISAKPHAPLVGSYEESILRGRMSMNPSKPLDFTAQIGVLGKGKCKAHLKCPPHVTVPFPAVFYSYPTSGSGRSISDDNPSPYVGQIDLENSLPRDELNTTRRRRRRASPATTHKGVATEDANSTRVLDADTIRRREKKSRRAESPKCPPGGCYRIPQQGQLQIMIKSPHKTAVKLFLVPYDLSDMEPGTKTFIRQRSYSAGPILDMPLSARKNFGTDRPEASLNTSEDPKDKPVLRYLVHLNICCPARGRFFLHSSIRVVFANRVPDGKESLRNEIQLPEPRYSPYKPTRDSTLLGSAGARAAIEKASRRRSVGQGTVPPLLRPHLSSPSDLPSQWDVLGPAHVAQKIPNSSESNMYNKLNKGDVGYGGYPFSPSGEGPDFGESLLAKRLRSLDVHKHDLERQGQGTKPSTSTR
ncbi:hypothetical protein N7474_000413 [Penicillium riverlandense]|uniref:uncharacterized protein n=1 Tax=Penicillium riverlandense TaxID=1903569 RepID=UPI0025479B6E|nr:uncharacterized protein N7474_000413 [Penicillium riverlandense]KAJ5832102.1 hypothetical protein N7474_000413 [Penicillium riverlandense]